MEESYLFWIWTLMWTKLTVLDLGFIARFAIALAVWAVAGV